ncbi:hypothetical protein T265_12639, partial [Opisthorchis viverrini]
RGSRRAAVTCITFTQDGGSGEDVAEAEAPSNCRACYGILRFIMESGARGAEVIVSGKIKGQRAKSMKFSDGLMIHSGDPVNYYIDKAVRHVLLP